MPTDIWGHVTALLSCGDIARLSATCPSMKAYLRTPGAVFHFHPTIRPPAKRGTVVDFPVHWYTQFPTITSIGLTKSRQLEFRINISAEIMKNFPRTLCHLHLNFQDPINDELVAFLPRYLLTLNLPFNYSIGAQGFEKLPEFLETLHLPSNPNFAPPMFAILPRKLTALTVKPNLEISDTHMSQAPKTLKNLKIVGSSRLTGPAIRLAPNGLTSLKWDISEAITEAEIQLLPETLQELYVQKMSFPDTCIPMLPNGLLRLFIMNSTPIVTSAAWRNSKLSSLAYFELRTQTFFEPGFFASLPRALHSLRIPQCNTVSLADLKQLPANLYILDLRKCNSFENSFFENLPPRLHFLSISWIETITEEFIHSMSVQGSLPIVRLEMLVYDSVENAPSELPMSSNYSFGVAWPCTSSVPRRLPGELGVRFDVFLFEINPRTHTISMLDVYPKRKDMWLRTTPDEQKGILSYLFK